MLAHAAPAGLGCRARESASVPVPVKSVLPEGSGAGEKGLKTGAIGFISGVVIGAASTAPGYSLAGALGLVVAVSGIGIHAPVVMIAAFIPMLLVASAYYWMNRADPDCGTTFSWVTRAMGPSWGWIGGWAIIVADVIVMANLAQIAGLYTFLLFGVTNASTFWVTVLGVVFIMAMTYICVIGIELNAKTGRINADLTAGADLTAAEALLANEALCSPGVKLHGAGFIVTPEQAAALGLGKRPGLERHIRDYRNGRDLMATPHAA